MENEKTFTCESCKWHFCQDVPIYRICHNPDSDHLGIWTDDDDWCDEWEGHRRQ